MSPDDPNIQPKIRTTELKWVAMEIAWPVQRKQIEELMYSRKKKLVTTKNKITWKLTPCPLIASGLINCYSHIMPCCSVVKKEMSSNYTSLLPWTLKTLNRMKQTTREDI